jgi:nucleoside-diphosphate-sugar epimerase
MLIPMILRNDVHYMNSNHSRDFIHVYDILSAIDAIMNNEVYGVLDIGTGETNRLLDIADYFKIDCIKMIGDETERLDNKADVTVLNNLGWQAKINLFKYIEENRNVN